MSAATVVLHALRPDPGTAREWLRAELTHREYQPSLLERVIGWFSDFLNGIIGAANDFGRLSPAVAGVALVLLVIGLAAALARLRRDPSGRIAAAGPLLAEHRTTADEHRGLAERARSDGRYDDTVIEAMRAIAVGLVERAIIDDRPGATAREVAGEAAAAFDVLAERLHPAADRFDIVMYGDRHAGRADADELLDLEAAVRRARPSATDGADPVMAVPR